AWPTDDSQPTILSTGYSRELLGNTHAEANALAKLTSDHILSLFPASNVQQILARVDVYTTMEPCSVRSSGLAPCADALIAAAVRRCFIGVGEPADFVKCEGAQKLKDAGIEVIWLEGLEKECLEIARRRALV
ncbi:cytidine deaminase-like protein, partial [Roridomyces roridus]